MSQEPEEQPFTQAVTFDATSHVVFGPQALRDNRPNCAEQFNDLTGLSPIHESTRAQPGNRPTADALRAVTGRRTGLELPSKMTFDKWLSMGLDLAMAASSAAWWLGDWLIYGEKFFTGRYRSAIEQTSLDYKTLRNYAWVARKFSPERRHEGLSFGHHAEVAALAEPEQDFWLRKAETLGWTRNELRRGVRASLRERNGTVGAYGPDEASAEPGDGEIEHLSVRLTPQQLDVIRLAASNARVAVDIWITRILEQAALRVINSIGRERELERARAS